MDKSHRRGKVGSFFCGQNAIFHGGNTLNISYLKFIPIYLQFKGEGLFAMVFFSYLKQRVYFFQHFYAVLFSLFRTLRINLM